MSRKVLAAPSDMPLDVLAYVMIDQQIGGTPVVDESGRPIGMISKTDLLRELRDLSDAARAAWDPWEGEEAEAPRASLPVDALSSRTAIDAMTPIVYWLPEDASISQAAALMAYEHVHGIPVVNKAGKVSGLVTTLDVLRWFARRRGYLIPK
jgi:CBS domain-containing protein